MVDPTRPPSSPLHAGTDDVLCHTGHRAGGFDDAAAAAAVVVRERFQTGRHTGLPIETRGLVARWNEDGSRLELWGPTKFLHFTRRTLAGFFGIPADHVVCHRVDVGGMFGPRGEVYPEDFLVPWASRVTGRPVKWVEDRREHLLTVHHSRDQIHEVELAVAADGTFLGLRDRVVVDMGAYARPIGSRVPDLVLEGLPGPYRWASLDISVTGRLTNKTPVGTVRGPSALEANFVRERVIDMAAHKLGLDPLDVRRRNLIAHTELPFTRQLGPDVEETVYDSGDYLALLDDLLTRVDYQGMAAQARARRAAGEHVGCGVGIFLEPSGIGASETVSVRLEDGRFIVGTSATEVGQGLEEMIEIVAAASLGVDAALVSVESGSTEAHEGGTGTFGSRGTIFVGSATRDGGTRLIARARAVAAEKWDVPIDDVHVHPAGLGCGDDALAWAELAPMEEVGSHETSGPSYGFGCHIAQVRVDPATGSVIVERLVVGYDLGTVIDRAGVEGQLVGAAVQGLGGTLFEEILYDDNGQPLCTSFMDYLVPTATDVPEIEAVIYELEPAPGNPLGAKGAGEAGIACVAAAVANAVADACGDRSAGATRLPLTPERILGLLDGRAVRASIPPPAREATAASHRSAPSRGPNALLAAFAAAALVVLARRRRRRRSVAHTKRRTP